MNKDLEDEVGLMSPNEEKQLIYPRNYYSLKYPP